MELNDNDKQRIEQEAMAHSTLGKNYLGETLYDTKAHGSFKEGAEYATIYERRPTCQSCHKGKVNSQGECDFCGAHAVLVALMPKPDVEAELRNKVIDECIVELTKAGFNIDCAETDEDRENAEILFKNLEGLKTK